MDAQAPQSIGVLMDGNRRYARSRGIPQLEGHRLGVRKIKDLVGWAGEAGIREIILYGFSTENWNRAPEEVSYLMGLFEETFGGPDIDEIRQNGFRVQFIGQRDRLPKRLQEKMRDAEARTADGEAGVIVIALSYGGRAEIVEAVNRLLASGVQRADEENLRAHMWSAGTRDPDLVIRTGGDKRLSNFLPWQSVYSELFFTNTYWPAFEKREFDSILSEFSMRERRHGR